MRAFCAKFNKFSRQALTLHEFHRDPLKESSRGSHFIVRKLRHGDAKSICWRT